MNIENLKLWLDALRSGEYEQGPGFLKKDDKYCCLGVLCEVAISNGVPVEVSTTSDGTTNYNGGDARPPAKVMEWLGLGVFDVIAAAYLHRDPWGETRKFAEAAYMNDHLALPFDKIADLLETTYIKPEVGSETVSADS